MKYIIEITELDKRPEDWTKVAEWPHQGIFTCKDDTSMYHVYSYGVNYISYQDDFVKRPVTDAEFSNQITEDLLLKAIAAASKAQTLK
jgi:hypothetical protein